ncbi:gibberellin 2-beta-dioxygenase 1-like [Silene latifolia]|uniref:gibberellin 2-beta-dioxygenase 1-like n=1 Tax=Silene latifolia TaxID=37657 RepID=UPI003D788D9D
MVTLSKPVIEQLSLPPKTPINKMLPSIKIPLIDLSKPDSKALIVKACEEFGFFKVINHGVPTEFISRLEREATKFFSLPLSDKQLAGPPNPYGYGHKKIGNNGDVGWIEYLLMNITPQLDLHHHNLPSIFSDNPMEFRCAVEDYVQEVRRMACEVLELIADGLRIQPTQVFSKLLKDEKSDSVFRLNHYPPCPSDQLEFKNNNNNNNNMIGFGEHTDPQIISVLRSNNTCGLEIFLQDGNWLPVPPDQNSFFFNVGDSLQVMTNGRFKSVRHRVITNKLKSRISMIYFGGPPMSERIRPLPSLTGGDDETSLYKEFTWFEYKTSAYKSRLADNRLVPFQKIAAS